MPKGIPKSGINKGWFKKRVYQGYSFKKGVYKGHGFKKGHPCWWIEQNISCPAIGHKVTDKHKEILRKSKLGKNNPRYNVVVSEMTKQRLRESRFKYLKQIGKINGPNIGKQEKQILDEIAKHIGYKIIRQYFVRGYFVDGYIPQLNIVIEVDEPHHKRKQESDIKRENIIKKELKCEVLRIKL